MLTNELTPLQCIYLIDYDDTAGIDFNQTAADVALFVIPFKCEVQFAAIAVTETCAGDVTTPVVKFDRRVTAGSDASRTDGTIANLVLSTTAAGKVMYDLVAVGETAGTLYPGDEVVVELAVSATGTGSPAGHGRPILMVKNIPEVQANFTDTVVTT